MSSGCGVALAWGRDREGGTVARGGAWKVSDARQMFWAVVVGCPLDGWESSDYGSAPKPPSWRLARLAGGAFDVCCQ